MLEKEAGETAFSKPRDYLHDQLTGMLGYLSHLDRSPDGRTCRDSAQQHLLRRQPSRHADRVIIADRNDLVDIFRLQDLGNEYWQSS
jgi:hypothetical protein